MTEILFTQRQWPKEQSKCFSRNTYMDQWHEYNNIISIDLFDVVFFLSALPKVEVSWIHCMHVDYEEHDCCKWSQKIWETQDITGISLTLEYKKNVTIVRERKQFKKTMNWFLVLRKLTFNEHKKQEPQRLGERAQ